MIPRDFDWRYLRRRTGIPLVTALLSFLAFIAAYYADVERRAVYQALTVDKAAVQEDYNALVLRRRLVERYHARYRQFHTLGFVGQESRLDWIHALRVATEDLTLPRLSYAIAPQLDVIAPVQAVLTGDDIAINVSRLELEMGLVHEVDLLRFIDGLQQSAPGLMRVQACTLEWQTEAAARAAVEANLLANCSLEIFSVITSDVRQQAALQ
ncbi:MAG: hypothetical protein AAFX56_02000 [Pseudomonadota bacterium]